MNMKQYFGIMVAAALVLHGCSPAGGNKRGHEFMPDMVHSTAYEANIYNYYYYNTWGSEEEYKSFVEPRKPVDGTVPRGYISAHYQDDKAGAVMAAKAFTGATSKNAIAYTPNGHVPYYYDDTEEERNRAMAEIVENPYPITAEGLERGKELYIVYCGICHGEKGDGLGYLVREAEPAKGITAGVYPAAPANFLQEEFYNASNGRYYHSIMYGKNVMGAYADKLSYEERWQVIHWIRALQAKEQGLKYDENENTFAHGVPVSQVAMAEDKSMEEAHGDADGTHQGDGSHSDHHEHEHGGEH